MVDAVYYCEVQPPHTDDWYEVSSLQHPTDTWRNVDGASLRNVTKMTPDDDT